MKKNIGKIILVLFGAALIVWSAKGLMSVPGQRAALEAAVYLEEAVVLPENEGKLVIIHGEPEMLAPAYDEELKLTINSIHAYRYKETYKQTGFTDDERKWEWDYVDFDPAETKDYVLTYKSIATGEVCVLPDGGYYADTNVTYIGDSFFNFLGAHSLGERLEGKTAYRYKYYNPEKNGVHTIAGVQQGNRLAKDENVGAFVRDGVLPKEKVISANANSIIGGAAVFMLLGVVLIVLGLRKTKSIQKGK